MKDLWIFCKDKEIEGASKEAVENLKEWLEFKINFSKDKRYFSKDLQNYRIVEVDEKMYQEMRYKNALLNLKNSMQKN